MSSLLFNVGMHLEARRIRESASRRYLGDISAASSMRALEHAVFANRLPVLRERQSAGQCYARRDIAEIAPRYRRDLAEMYACASPPHELPIACAYSHTITGRIPLVYVESGYVRVGL